MVLKRVFGAAACAYAVLLAALLLHPASLRAVVFLHWVPYPVRPDFARPEKYALRASCVRNMRVQTADNVAVGMWHVVSPLAVELAGKLGLEDLLRREAETVVIYLHGNAGNRAFPNRVALYKELTRSSRDTHVLALDYRGFGDSEGRPSEAGVQFDVRAVFDYVTVTMGVPSHKVVIIGHSLGTAIATRFVQSLDARTEPVRALVLLAPFSSLAEVALTYPLAPFLWPFRYMHRTSLVERLSSRLSDPFLTAEYIRTVPASVRLLIVHGTADREIPATHSYRLFAESLGHAQRTFSSAAEFAEFARVAATSGDEIQGARVFHDAARRRVLAEVEHAGHNNLVYFEPVVAFLNEFIAER